MKKIVLGVLAAVVAGFSIWFVVECIHHRNDTASDQNPDAVSNAPAEPASPFPTVPAGKLQQAKVSDPAKAERDAILAQQGFGSEGGHKVTIAFQDHKQTTSNNQQQ